MVLNNEKVLDAQGSYLHYSMLVKAYAMLFDENEKAVFDWKKVRLRCSQKLSEHLEMAFTAFEIIPEYIKNMRENLIVTIDYNLPTDLYSASAVLLDVSAIIEDNSRKVFIINLAK